MEQQHRGIFVFSENKSASLELLTIGRKLADELQTDLSIILTSGTKSNYDEYATAGADRIYVTENSAFQIFNVEIYADIITDTVAKEKPELVLIGSTRRGKELAPKISTRLGTGCVTDCIGFNIDKEKRLIQMSRVVYSGKAIAVQVCTTMPQIATVPPRTFEPEAVKKGRGEVVETLYSPREPRIKIIETKAKAAASADIEKANIVVCGGRGIKSREDFKLLEELADLMKGQVSCSRPVAADRGWFTDWVGLSGHKVKPELYISCGVSGAIQHKAGISNTRIIAAIDTNPDAPIFRDVDYGVVGNLYEIVPALIKTLKKQQ